MQEYNICYSLDSNYAEQLAVSICSMLQNSEFDENFNFFILDGGLTVQDKKNIEKLKNIKDFNINYININLDDFENCPLLKEKDEKYETYHVSLPTYFRFKLPSLLPDIKKLLYLDCDVIIRGSLNTLYNTDIKNNAVLMALDVETKRESKRLNIKKYYNAGVILINLDFWRKNNIEDKLFDYAKNNSDKILWQDQDIINVVLENEIKKLDNCYNYQYFLYENVDIKDLSGCLILHFAGRFKPWLMAFEHPLYDYYYSFLIQTAWKSKLLEYKQNASGKVLKNNIGGNETNIIVNATDEDIQKVYTEITNNYEFTKTIVQTNREEIQYQTDEKISHVYDEITNNYEFTKNIVQSNREEIQYQTDEKISQVYNEISKNYDYTTEIVNNVRDELNKNRITLETLVNNTVEVVPGLTDEKISKVYDEITSNYEFTKDVVKSNRIEIETQTDEKLNKVYEEISNNYKYTDALTFEIKEYTTSLTVRLDNINEELISRINYESSKTSEDISKIYDEITNNYEFTKSIVKTNRDEIQQETDQKISQVYDEITNNYEFAKNIVQENRNAIENQTNESISKIYDEITNNYEFTKDVVKSNRIEIETQTDEKLNKVYEEISNNYKYTDALAFEIKEYTTSLTVRLDNINEELISRINYESSKTNEDISKIYDEITNNYEFTKTIVQSNRNEIQNQTDEKISKIYECINSEVNQKGNEINKVYEEISNNYHYTEKLVYDLEEKTKSFNNTLNNTLNNKLDDYKYNINEKLNYIDVNNINRLKEIYSYINEQTSGMYSEIKENQLLINNKIENKNIESNEKINANEKEIINLNINKADKSYVQKLSEDYEFKIKELDKFYSEKFEQVKTQFEEELNNQRIKYEKKLIEMENIINSLDSKYQPKKKSFFERFKK